MSSGVWQYFSKGDKEQVKCGICLIALSYKGGSTYSLKRHLERKHDVEIHTKKKKENSTEVATAAPKLTEFIKRKSKLESESPRARIITHKIAKTIYRDLQPLSVTEDEGFRELIF